MVILLIFVSSIDNILFLIKTYWGDAMKNADKILEEWGECINRHDIS